MQGFETNITSVEISLTDKCNRSCSFCPQTFDSFQNLYTDKFIEYKTLVNIKNQLDQFSHKPLISLAGFGEPLLYKKIVNAVKLFDDYKIIIFTNLDNTKLLYQIDQENVFIFGNLYDESRETHYIELLNKLTKSKFTYVKHWEADLERYQNRNKLFDYLGKEEDLSKPCNHPISSLMIDHLGNIILCCNDWYRSNIFGNINDSTILNIINGKYKKIAQLINGNRNNYEFCVGCNQKFSNTLSSKFERMF